MRYIAMTPASFHGTQWHLASFESYSVAVKTLPLLADVYDTEVQLWERDTIRARYSNGRVHFEEGADIPS